MANKKEKIIFLELSRIIFISFVLFYHLQQYVRHFYFSELFGEYYSFFGSIGVAGFVFLSGTLLQLRYGDNNIDFRSFIKKRFIRIAPLYYLILFIHTAFIEPLGWRNFFLHTLFVHNISAEFSHNPPVLWFVGLIMQLYLLSPLLHRLFNRNKGLFIVTSLILFLFNQLLTLENIYLNDFAFKFVYLFAAGMFMSEYLQTKTFKSTREVFISALYLLFLLILENITQVNLKVYLIPFNLAAILAVLLTSRLITQIINQKEKLLHAISIGGYSTFCVFLFHPTIWRLFSEQYYSYFAPNLLIDHIVIGLGGVMIIFFVSFHIQIIFDKIIANVRYKI